MENQEEMTGSCTSLTKGAEPQGQRPIAIDRLLIFASTIIPLRSTLRSTALPTDDPIEYIFALLYDT